MQLKAGFSDAATPFTGDTATCGVCGSALRIERGTCLSCMLQEGLTEGALGSDELFEAVLGEAAVPDTLWRIGNYEVQCEIGRGGMGIIYRARQLRSRRVVAVKRVLTHRADSRDLLHRFRREAEAAASLDHPNILPIYEVSETEDGLPFFSMKLATGGSLRDAGPAFRHDHGACVTLMAKVARAVEYAHGIGVLHRDLQPGNILLDGRGEPMVSDFGLAKWLNETSDLTQTLTTFGTPGYIAPEQSEGSAANVGEAADIYSLGAVLFNLIAGRPPFAGASALSVMRQAAEHPAPRLRTLVPEVDRQLEIVVERCLQRDPKARYASAGALAEDLERLRDGRPILARPVLPPERLWRWARRNPSLAGAAMACTLLSAALIFLLARETAKPLLEQVDKSVAVLPFENAAANEANAVLASGIQTDVLAHLAKVADLKVISRASVRDFAPGAARDLRQIGAALGVRHIVEGSVNRSNDRIRVSAALVDTLTGQQLWAETYERDYSELFGIESAIAQEIASRLQAGLSENEQAQLVARPTSDMLAYELYLQALDIGDQAGLRTAERITTQVALLDEATGRDPQFVEAFCLLARAHVNAYWSNHDHTPARLLAVHSALDAASRLRPNAGEVHLARGILHYWGYRDYVNALRELSLAAKVMPNNADVPHFIGLIKRRQGDWAGSTAKLEQARAMDPRNDTILFELTRTNYFALKRYKDAAEACDSVLVRKPRAFDFALARAKVDLAERADLTRLQALLRGPAAKNAEPQLLAFERLELGLLERDFEAAADALATHALPTFNWAGYVTPREWYSGLIAAGMGDHERADAEFQVAHGLLADIVAARPDDAKAYIVQAEIAARLGRKAEAIAAGEHALALRPVAKDAVDGVHIMGRLAGVYAQVSEIQRALQLLDTAVKAPNGPNYGALMLEDTWDPLRNDPRFEGIVASVAPRLAP